MPNKVAKDDSQRSGTARSGCIFCQIASRNAPSHILYEDADYIAFLDKFPFSRGHTLVCPKKHGETIWDMSETEIGGLFTTAARVSKAVAAAVGADGFRFVQNNGEAANQVVAHVHVHVIPVRLEDKGRFMERRMLSSDEMDTISRNIQDGLVKMRGASEKA
jgi:histidine triad (HIT) family protein